MQSPADPSHTSRNEIARNEAVRNEAVRNEAVRNEAVPAVMQALVYSGTCDMRLTTSARPIPILDEVLVKVAAVGICGSDMHAYHGHDPRRVPPMILGHEASGTIMSGDRAGERVTFNPIAFCGHCNDCLDGRQNLCSNRTMIGMQRPGAFADYLCVPERCLIPIPDSMDPVAAALTEPTATAVHAVTLGGRSIGSGYSGRNALVIGAGSIGLLIAGLLRHQGCSAIDIVDTNPLRRQTAVASGYGEVHDPVHCTVRVDHYDVVFDAVGATPTRQSAIQAVRPGGSIVHVGLQQGSGDFDFRKLTLAEITFIGAYTYTQSELIQAVKLLHAGVFGSLNWVSIRPMAEGAQAFSALHEGSSAAAKIVLIPGGASY